MANDGRSPAGPSGDDDATMDGRSPQARRVTVSGVVQGVGFRPFVLRLAQRHRLRGWVRNDGRGVSIHLEGAAAALDRFASELTGAAPPAARIERIACAPAVVEAHASFEIVASGPPAGTSPAATSVPISADLPVCDACVSEMRDPADRRYGYPYINCTDCGPRYSVVLALPYDRPNTTLRDWPLCAACRREYEDPRDRRFHAQPTACPACGPAVSLTVCDRPADHASGARKHTSAIDEADLRGGAAIAAAAQRLARGEIVAIKGIGGYHLACDARDDAVVGALRERKFRKEKPFAVMAADLAVAHAIARLGIDEIAALTSVARPIVLVPAREPWPLVAPDETRLGLLLPYAPLHYLLFAAGAPEVLVMTSANRSSEPIAYRDDDARDRLSAIADAILGGERPIARRVDDSVVMIAGRIDDSGLALASRIDDSVAVREPPAPTVVRRSRGYAPGAVARIPARRPYLAVGADLKNSVTLLVDGQAFVSPHIGDLDDLDAFASFRDAIADLLAVYALGPADVTVVHDLHPQYRSTEHARELGGGAVVGVQHHHAHIASVLAEGGLFDERVIGVALDGTGYGCDGTIWGGEFFVGDLRGGFERVLHQRTVHLPGGDAAARYPALCAVGWCADRAVDLAAAPFAFSADALAAQPLVERRIGTHLTSSAGRLFDAIAALCGFTRRITFEGQAAIWLEAAAARSDAQRAYPASAADGILDVTDLIGSVIDDRRNGRPVVDIARAFHLGYARALADAATSLAAHHDVRSVALSGGVWQNTLLLAHTRRALEAGGLTVRTNRSVPCNDGGISLGQVALAALRRG